METICKQSSCTTFEFSQRQGKCSAQDTVRARNSDQFINRAVQFFFRNRLGCHVSRKRSRDVIPVLRGRKQGIKNFVRVLFESMVLVTGGVWGRSFPKNSLYSLSHGSLSIVPIRWSQARDFASRMRSCSFLIRNLYSLYSCSSNLGSLSFLELTTCFGAEEHPGCQEYGCTRLSPTHIIRMPGIRLTTE